MFRVSYRYGKFNDSRHKDFCAFASALMYFLQKFHEGRPDLRLSVVYDEFLDSLEEVNSDENV